MSATALRQQLAGERAVPVPGVWDPVTATLARDAGHAAAHLSGAVCSALELGLPDLGYVHGTHIAHRALGIAPALAGVPLIADADTGYGTALHARWTAQRYAAAGIAGLHLEDQLSPKRCGHLAGKQLIGAAEATAKVAAVAEAGTGIVVIARTDAYTVAGLAETIERCRAFADAGADALFPEGVTAPDELAAISDAVGGRPLVVNASEAGSGLARGLIQTVADRPAHKGGSQDDSRLARLAKVGVRLVLQPTAALLAALAAARTAYQALAADGSADSVGRMAWADFTGLVGQTEALELDAAYGARA